MLNVFHELQRNFSFSNCTSRHTNNMCCSFGWVYNFSQKPDNWTLASQLLNWLKSITLHNNMKSVLYLIQLKTHDQCLFLNFIPSNFRSTFLGIRSYNVETILQNKSIHWKGMVGIVNYPWTNTCLGTLAIYLKQIKTDVISTWKYPTLNGYLLCSFEMAWKYHDNLSFKQKCLQNKHNTDNIRVTKIDIQLTITLCYRTMWQNKMHNVTKENVSYTSKHKMG